SRRRHTRSDRDWSSDVCSSDLPPLAPPRRLERVAAPVPPDLERHVLRDVPLGQIYPYLNLQMLYGKHLGVRGPVERLLEAGDARSEERRVGKEWRSRCWAAP